MDQMLTREFKPIPARSIQNWTPPQVRSALRALQTGSFNRATSLFDEIQADDRASSVISTRANGICSLPVSIEPAEETNRARAEAIAAAFREDWKKISEDSDLDLMLSYGRGVGVAIFELIWTTDASSGRWIPSLKFWSPKWLEYDTQKEAWYLQTQEARIEIEPNSGKWILFTPFGVNNWTGARSFVRTMSVPYLSKRYGVTDWNAHSEKLGQGVIVGKTGIHADADERDAFKNDLFNLASSGAIVLPEGFDVDLLEARYEASSNFDKLISWADKSFGIAALGQNLSTEVSGGSFSAAQVHDVVRRDYILADAETLSKTITRGLLKFWTEFNFGADEMLPNFFYNASAPKDEKATAETQKIQFEGLEALSRVDMNPAGVQVDFKELLLNMGVPFVEVNPQSIEAFSRDPEQTRLKLPVSLSLASGDTDGDLLASQMYVEELRARAVPLASEMLAGNLDAIMTRVSSVEKPEDVRGVLLALFEDLDVYVAEEMLAKVLKIAYLAGVLSESSAAE